MSVKDDSPVCEADTGGKSFPGLKAFRAALKLAIKDTPKEPKSWGMLLILYMRY